jgi:hypothetical protein
LSQWLYAGYLQDDWRITPRVTLNLGLRYEYQGVPTEDRNLLGNFEPRVGLEQVGKNISSIYNGDHKNFSPRFGVAWDVTGKGTTVVRAGGSIIYQLLSMSTFLSQQNTQNTVTLGVGTVPTGATIVTCPAGTLAAPACSGPGGTGTPVITPGIGNILATGITIPGSSLAWQNQSTAIYPASVTGLVQCGDGVGTDPGPCDTFAMERNFRTPYVENWTLGVQHAFSNKISMDLSYVGNHAAKLSGVVDLNQPAPGGARPLAPQFPYLGFINYLSNLYGSTYHGLQATLTSRNFHGLDFLAGYTYSHALDYDSSNWVAFLPKDSTHPGLERGSSDFDIRHRFTLSMTYTFPEKKTWGQFLEGWQVNTIITLQSGQPWQVNDQVNNFSLTGEMADRWDFFGNPSDFHSDGPKGIPFCTSPPNGPTSPITPLNSPSCSQTDAFGNSVSFSAAQTATAWNACLAKARDTTNGGTLQTGGCFVQGNSLLVPPAPGTFGTMGRNIFRDTGFHNVDLSITKGFRLSERFRAQFRAEMFNVFNHPSFANEWGGASTYGPGGVSDPATGGGSFGCGCATPDNASVNPVLGSGSNRAIQLGLKFLF